MDKQTLETRRELCAAFVTLDGEPAKIVGAKEPYATVRTVRTDGPQASWSWESAARIVENGGRFRL